MSHDAQPVQDDIKLCSQILERKHLNVVQNLLKTSGIAPARCTDAGASREPAVTSSAATTNHKATRRPFSTTIKTGTTNNVDCQKQRQLNRTETLFRGGVVEIGLC